MRMGRSCLVRRNGPWSRWIWIALVIVSAVPPSAFAAERVVLGEYFNALW